jgi:hypothetical protein
MKKVIILIFLSYNLLNGQELALLKYNGGGDWYANPTSLPNLIKFCNQNLSTKLKPKHAVVEANSIELFSYPFVHLTGHGNIVFTSQEITNLRNYMLAGGFLHIDDNYGLDQYIRKEITKIFPDKAIVELPANHEIFQKPYNFPGGLPKIHQHDNKPAKAFAIMHDDRIVLLYTYETDLGDGWEDIEIHNNPEELRQKALRMGANIINYVFNE